MKRLKLFLRKLDAFGVPFSFKYKGDNKYQTSLGGLFVVAFVGVALWIGIYYFLPFINRKNFTIVYYTMSLPYAEQINLKETQAAFAVGLDCYTGSDGTNAVDVLKLSLSYTTQKKEKDGSKKRKIITLPTHTCTYEDFYNKFDDSLEYLNMDIFQCLDDNSQIVEGIYTDEVFSYYTFTVSTKEDTPENFERLNNYLLENDCKLNVYYTDITIDLNNYENPIKHYLDSIFIQLDPNYIKKMNAYFLNQYLYDDDYLIWNFNDEENSQIQTKFSRVEEYSLYKGMNRYGSNLYDYQNYAMLYIRADTKRTEIKRKYQKLMEFYADASSMLIAIFEILAIIFGFINDFYAEHSVKKKLFLFKEFEYKNFNLSKKINQIKELIQATNDPKSRNNINSNEFSTNIKETYKNTNFIGKESGQANIFNNEDIYIYNRRRRLPINQSNNDYSKEKDILKSNNDEMPNEVKNTDRRRRNFKYNNNPLKKTEFNKEKNNIMNMEKNFSSNRNNLYTRTIKNKITEEYPLENVNIEKMEYSFNVFEIIGVSFFKCCLSKKLSLKHKLNEKANEFLYNKLDISLYVRNMILLDIINKTLLEDNMNSIINFVSRPIFSINKTKEKEFESLYQTYNDTEFDKFSNELYELSRKSDKKSTEKKLINISNKQLKELV